MAAMTPEAVSSSDEAPELVVADASALARGGVINVAGALTYAILNFAVVAIVTRSLGVTRAGSFLEAIALFSILARSSTIGADVGLTRFVSRYGALDRSASIRPTLTLALVPVAVASIAIAVAVFAFADPIGRLLSKGGGTDIANYIRVMAPFIPVSALYQTLDGCARGFGTMVPSFVVERIGRPVLQPILLLAAFSAGLGTTAVALAWSVPWALALVPSAIWVHHLLTRLERRSRSASEQRLPDRSHLARVFWRFTVPRSLGAVLQVGILWADTLLLGALSSSRDAGIYAASTRWLLAGQFAGMAITTAFAPQISSILSRGTSARAGRLFETATVWFILLAWPAYLTVMIFGYALVRAFGKGFEAGGSVLVILGAAGLFAAAAGPVDMVLLMGGRSTLSLLNNLLALVSNIGLNIVLIPRLGLDGAAIAWAVSMFLTNALPLWQVHRNLGLHPFGRRWIVAVATGSVIIVWELAARVALGDGPLALVVGVAVAISAYVAVLWRLRERLDLDSFMSGLKRRPTSLVA